MGGCASPKSYPNLPDGYHAFKVRATDTAGNVVEATPASRTWTIATRLPPRRSHPSPHKRCRHQDFGERPTTKYGATSPLGADGDEPDSSGKDACALIKWDLSTIPTSSRVDSVSVTL